MRRLSLFILWILLTMPAAQGQGIRGVLGFPDRIMSSSRIGRVSSREMPVMPAPDTVRISFPLGGIRPVSMDFDFFNYLVDNELKQDARTLACGSYALSDTLDFIRAKVLFSERKLAQSSELFSRIPYSSPFGPESFFYRIVALSSIGEYGTASDLLSSNTGFIEGGPYSELAALQAAGLALLKEDENSWRRSSSLFTYSDFTLSESERILLEIGTGRFSSRQKSAGIAALASAVVPGAGKVYAGRLGEGVAAFLTVGSLGGITAANWKKHGSKDWRTILSGSLCAAFYLGNIYGSYMSVSIEKDERLQADNTLILYHLHLPLRSVFR
jgi:hypothetical protein